MKKASLAVFALPFILTGCLLQQEAPKNSDSPQKNQATIAGIVTLQDIQGDSTQATLSAAFAASAPKSSFQMVRQALEKESPPSKMNCRVQQKKPAVRSVATTQFASNLVSLGKVFFGPALQASYSEIPEEKDHRYYKKFDSSLPTNIYMLKVEGGDYSKGFGEPFSLPEPITGFNVVNNTEIKTNTELSLRWSREAVKNSNSIDMIEIQSGTDSETTLLRCFAMEKDFEDSDQKISITVDSKYLSQLPKSEKAMLLVSRVHVHNSERADIEYQGLRSWSVKVQLKD